MNTEDRQAREQVIKDKVQHLFDTGQYLELIEMANTPEDYPEFDFTEVLECLLG